MSSVPLAKHLGSNDKKIRDKAVLGLAAFLSDESNPPLTQADMEKLWKGIFYCYWMSDKPLVQQALSSELAELLLKIKGQQPALAFLRGFWQAMVREWSGIDRLRMDKYYMLVRKYVYASFVMLINLQWDPEACSRYEDILTERGGPITQESKTPCSLMYHLADIYLEELDRALQVTQTSHPAPLTKLMGPFIDMLGHTPSNITFDRIKSSLLDPILEALTSAAIVNDAKEPPQKRMRITAPDYSYLSVHVCTEPTSSPESPEAIKMSLLKAVFSNASHGDTRESNRRKLYAIWKAGMLEYEQAQILGRGE